MRSSNATFDTYHAKSFKVPVYLVHFDGEGVDYVNHTVGSPDNTLKKYLVDISGASQRVTPEEGRASIGGINFTLLDKDGDITTLISGDTYSLHYKKTTIKMGYQGMDESDMLTIMVGRVTGLDMDRDGTGYEFDITDPSKELQRKIFRGAEDTPVTITGNPINILLQVLTSTGAGTNGDYDTLAESDGLGIDDDLINVTNIEAVRDDWFPGPAFRFSFTIKKRIQAKKWLEKEIFKILNIYPVIDADGKFNIKPFKPPLPATVSVQTFNDDNIMGLPTFDFNLKDLVNEVEVSYDWDSVDDEFDTQEFYIDSTSINNRGPGKSPIKLESKGATTALDASDMFALRKAKIFARYSNPPPPKISMSTFFSGWLTEAGDIVPISHSQLPDIENGTRGLTTEMMEVINRSIDWKRGRVKLQLLATGFGKDPYCQISPSATITSGTSATEFEVSSADAAKFNVGEEVAIHKPNMTIQAASVTITDISGTTITTDSIGATPAANWVMQYSVYDNCTADQKLYWFASDGSDYLGAANDAAHLITA